MDAQDWFKDSPVPANVRAYVDGVLKTKFDALADQMKDALNNLPTADAIDLTQTPIFKTIAAFGGAMTAIDTVFTPYFEMMATLVHASTRVAVGFVPAVGPVLDFCEAVTGRAWCMSDGAELSTEERIFSGAGVAVGGLVKFWGGVKNAGLGAKAAAVADDIAHVDEGLGEALHAQALSKPKKLRGAMKVALTVGEPQTVKHMRSLGEELWGIGDNGVRDVLGMAKDSKAPDMLTRLPDNKFLLTEVKWPTGDTLKLDANAIDKAKDQLLSGAAAFQAKPKGNLASYVRLAIPKGTALPQKYALKNGYLYFRDAAVKFESFFVKVLEVPPK